MTRLRWGLSALWLLACVCLQAVPLAGQADSLIDDFEWGDPGTRWWLWDDGSGFACEPSVPGYNSETALHMTFDISTGQFPGCGTSVLEAERWATAEGLSFWWRSDSPGLEIGVVLSVDDRTQSAPERGQYTPFVIALQTTGSEWTQFTLLWSTFQKGQWISGGASTLNPAYVVELDFTLGGPQRGEIWIDDLALMVGAASPQPSPVISGTFDKFALWANGTQLRGANIWQRVVVPWVDGDEFLGSGYVGPPLIQQDFDQLAAMGANVVNISGPGLYTEHPPYRFDEQAALHLDNLLAMAAQADMFVVITARTGPGRSDFTFYWDESADWGDASLINDDVWLSQDAQDAWVEMWRATAERYRDNRLVVGYDLMCEPNAPGRLLDIWEPADFYPAYAGTLYDWNQLYPRIVTAIREVDPDTPILISSMGWGAVRWLPALEPVDDPRVVYMVHQYEPQEQYTHQGYPPVNSYPGSFDLTWDDIPDRFDRTWLNGFLATIDDFRANHGVAVAVNEYGVVRWAPGAADFLRDSMDLFEQRGMNHSFWSWNPLWPPYAHVDEMNYLRGPDAEFHTDQETNAFIEVIREYWSRNRVRPSTIGQ